MSVPHTAMVMAAGLGTRMKPLTDTKPKALVPVQGRTLLDHQLDRLCRAGVSRAVVNVHHFADQVEAHLRARQSGPCIEISDERAQLMETGGGLVQAAQRLGDDPVYVMNVDAIWTGHDAAMSDLAAEFARHEGALGALLLVRKQHTLGLDTQGDFDLLDDGRIRRRGNRDQSEYYYTGTQILHPDLLQDEAVRPFSTNLLWDKALAQGRLFGLELNGFWMHVGDPHALRATQARLQEYGG